MRISDWSSDVCSSDLLRAALPGRRPHPQGGRVGGRPRGGSRPRGRPGRGGAALMPLFEFEGKRPQVHPEAFIAATATLVGDVVVEKGASVWYGVVLRADDCRIIVREGATIKDNSVVHGTPDSVVEVGLGATVAHSCIVHGATLGEKALLCNGPTLPAGTAQIGRAHV